MSTYIPSNHYVKDRAIWTHITTGVLTVKSICNLISSPKSTPVLETKFSWIWNLNCPSKIKFFIWQCQHERLPTKHHLHIIGLNISPQCPHCKTQETCRHIFLECTKVKNIWRSQLVKPIG